MQNCKFKIANSTVFFYGVIKFTYLAATSYSEKDMPRVTLLLKWKSGLTNQKIYFMTLKCIQKFHRYAKKKKTYDKSLPSWKKIKISRLSEKNATRCVTLHHCFHCSDANKEDISSPKILISIVCYALNLLNERCTRNSNLYKFYPKTSYLF